MTPRITTTRDFEARSSVGAVIATFQTPDQAARWVETEGDRFPGHSITRVTVRTTVEVIHQHQPQECAA